MNTALKKDSEFQYDSAFLDSLNYDDPRDGDHLYQCLSCMFPKNPLGPQDRPKHIPKIPTAEKMQAGLFALIARSVGRKEMLTHPEAIKAMQRSGTDFETEKFGVKT